MKRQAVAQEHGGYHLQSVRVDEYKPSRRRIAPIPPTSTAPSVSAKTRSFVGAVKVRRRGRFDISGAAAAGAGTVRFRFFVLHDHVMVVLRPCEAKLSGLRCLTIIGTEGNKESRITLAV
jgi:hypothetical protein